MASFGSEFVKKIKNYAVVSFVVPLIAINTCLLLYKFVGNLNIIAYPNFDWSQLEYDHQEYGKVSNNTESYTFTNCPKYQFYNQWISIDGQIIEDRQGDLEYDVFAKNIDVIASLQKNNKIKLIKRVYKKELNNECVKNHKFYYSFLTKFNWLEKLLLKTKNDNKSGFVEVKNPYFYGEVSISRTARFFPATYIFKSLIILSSLLLFLYWRNTLNLFNELKNKNVLEKFSKSFFYLGVLSCIFLILHASFLALDIDSKLFSKARKLIIISFILFEVFAQISLTKNLFKFKAELKEYINPLILKIKITFVAIVLLGTIVSFTILAFGDPSTGFKHTLEWNYFSFLLCYYLLSRLLWR